MRRNIVTPGADELKYEIRGIVNVAEELKKLGKEIIWENIGDPVEKGEEIPIWIKEIVTEQIKNNKTWGYCPTKGLDETREFLCDLNNKNGNVQITKEDIIFFNGLGDAISKIYKNLHPRARVLGPSPAYPTHSSAEAAHSGDVPLTYELDPNNNWYPDIEDIRNKVKFNNSIVAILLINPDNPTGVVYPKEILLEVVKIAKEYNLFLIVDEIYLNLIYNGKESIPISSVIGDLPAISLKGISKEIPWPGSRCGWMEVYNIDKDDNFKRFIKSIVDSKMLEVCSTTLPQQSIPLILGDERYKAHIRNRNLMFEERSKEVYEALKDIKGITINKTNGAFYQTIVFNKGVLNDKMTLKIENQQIKTKIEGLVNGLELDFRFVYYLLGASGICVVPLSSFATKYYGFRMTLLESDREKKKLILKTLKNKIIEYLNS